LCLGGKRETEKDIAGRKRRNNRSTKGQIPYRSVLEAVLLDRWTNQRLFVNRMKKFDKVIAFARGPSAGPRKHCNIQFGGTKKIHEGGRNVKKRKKKLT